MDGKIKIILLSGFLGAGKTTVLNELVRFFPDDKLGLLVNDFGEVPVDGSLLKQEHPEFLEEGNKIYEIGNGSIFCSCLKAPFLYGLKYFANEKPDFLFIEASGMSDPSSMDKILLDHGMEEVFTVSRVITLIDPLRYKALSHVLDVIDRQIQAADQLLLNKADLVSNEELEECEASLREKSTAPLQTGSFGRFDYSFVRSSVEHKKDGEMESCNTPETRPASLHLDASVAEPLLRDFMDFAVRKAYRIKGFLELEGKMHYISDNSRGFSVNEADSPGIRQGLTVLCSPEVKDEIALRWREMTGGAS